MKYNDIAVKNDNEIIVSVWKSRLHPLSVGHASIKTSKEYASFWPGENGLKQCTTFGVQSVHSTYLSDCEDEARAPDIQVTLQSLDVDEINKAYRAFRTANCNWSLWGSAYFNHANSRNCSGLVAFLLYKGGIEHLVDISDLNMQTGKATFGSAFKSAVIPTTVAVASTATKVAVSAHPVKIAAAVKIGFFVSSASYMEGACITPDDIADIVQAAQAQENIIYGSGSTQIAAKPKCIIL